MDYLLAVTLGILVGFLIALPAVILEIAHRTKNLPLLVDVHLWRGYKLNEREVFVTALLLHLIISALYGFLYVFLVEHDFLFITHAPFSLFSMIIVAAIFWLFLNVILFPAIGFGFMGFKEEKTAWFETFISLTLESALLWMLIQYYQPYFFMS